MPPDPCGSLAVQTSCDQFGENSQPGPQQQGGAYYRPSSPPKMLADIIKHVAVPVNLLFRKSDGLERMPSGVLDLHDRAIKYRSAVLPCPLKQAAAEVHILKPKRIEPFIHAPAGLKCGAANQQAGARRLFHRGLSLGVEIKAPIAPVHRVVGKDTVEQQDFEDEGCRSREAANRESTLKSPLRINQARRDRDGFSRAHQNLFEGRKGAAADAVGIQNQQ